MALGLGLSMTLPQIDPDVFDEGFSEEFGSP